MLWRHRLAYSVGHFLNDLCSAVWFTYTLVFFQAGLKLSPVIAGALVLTGQIADGLATPVVGYLCDRSQAAAVQYNATHQQGRWHRPRGRLAWHLAGSVLVILAFSFIYSPIYLTGLKSDAAKFTYYAAFIVIFQVGFPLLPFLVYCKSIWLSACYYFENTCVFIAKSSLQVDCLYPRI